MPNGACITRKCWCSKSPSTCPVHQLSALLCNERVSERPFFHLKQEEVNLQVRRRLCRLKIKDACEYRTHDFRRGHARDIQSSKNPLAELLDAGQWKSAAFKHYIDMQAFERDAFVYENVIASDSE